jgi:uncharacterized protein DUF3551
MVRRVGSIAGAGSTTAYRFTARTRATISSVLDEPAALRPNLQPCANFGPRPMGFNRRNMEGQHRQVSEKKAVARRATDTPVRRRLIARELETKHGLVFSAWGHQGGEHEADHRGAFAAIVCIEKPAQAQDYPWCAYYNLGQDGGGATNCGFVTFQQCLAMVSGIGGSCGANPMYQPLPGPHTFTRHPRHHPR